MTEEQEREFWQEVYRSLVALAQTVKRHKLDKAGKLPPSSVYKPVPVEDSRTTSIPAPYNVA